MDEIIWLVAILVTFGIFVILALLYSERKEHAEDSKIYAKESEKLMQLLTSGKISQETYERLRIKLEKERTYRKELENLSSLLSVKKIDQATYERLKKQLEEAHKSD